MSSFESQVAFLRAALDFLPRNEVDIYIPCAGLLGPPTQIAPAPPSELANLSAPPADLPGRLIGVNLTGVFLGTMLVARYGLGLHNNPKPEPPKSIVLIACKYTPKPVSGCPGYPPLVYPDTVFGG